MDRKEAGRILVHRLFSYQNSADTIVLGLPRGGVVVAFEAAQILNLPLDVIIVRKIGAPGNEEFAIGSLAEGVPPELDPIYAPFYPVAKVEEILHNEERELKARIDLYRKSCPKLDLANKNIILIDDGIATGHTMKSAIRAVKAQGAAKVIVAVPVCPPDLVAEFKALTDEFIVLETPGNFGAVGVFYKSFNQTSHEEVIGLLGKGNLMC